MHKGNKLELLTITLIQICRQNMTEKSMHDEFANTIPKFIYLSRYECVYCKLIEVKNHLSKVQTKSKSLQLKYNLTRNKLKQKLKWCE